MPQLQHNDATLQHWQSPTRDANAVFAAGNLGRATTLSLQASRVAQLLLSGPLPPDAAIAACTVSRLNLAEAFDRSGDPDRAANERVGIHLRLLKMALDPARSQPWCDAALRHSQRSHLELQHFLRSHDHARIARLLQTSHPPATPLN